MLIRGAHEGYDESQTVNDSDPLPRDIFGKIARQFDRLISIDQSEAFRTVDLTAFRLDLRRIQNEQALSGTMQNMVRIEAFMMKIQELGTLVHSLTDSNELMCLIWGSARLLFRVCINAFSLIQSI